MKEDRGQTKAPIYEKKGHEGEAHRYAQNRSSSIWWTLVTLRICYHKVIHGIRMSFYVKIRQREADQGSCMGRNGDRERFGHS